MAGPWEEYQQAEQSGPWTEYAEPQGATTGTTMPQAVGRKLPPTWDVNVDGQTARGLYDPEAKAYLVGMRDGTAGYINKNPDGSLGLKQYKGKVNAAGTDGENFAAGVGKAVVDTKRGIQQLGALAGNTLGLVDDETVDQSFADAQAVRARDADLMDTKAGIGGNVAGHIGSTVLGGSVIKAAGQGLGAIGKGMAASGVAPTAGTAVSVAGNSLSKAGSALRAPTTYKQAGAAGAATGATIPAESLGDKASTTAISGLAGVAGQGITKGVERLAKGASDVISQEVKTLAKTAKDKWGISVRADQVVNSKPLNAISTAVDYVPGSGAGVAKQNIQKQFNTALAKSIGQKSDNPAFAIREADKALGAEFDRVLQSTAVNADSAFTNDLSAIMQNARNEMTDQQFGVMQRQVDNILGKVQAGDVIDAQAAYNIKKGLDRIGKSNDSTLAAYATDMKKSLMEALNRSLGPAEAAKFAATRGQYSNLIALRKIVPRGAEADISPARLSNMKGYMTDDLNELADIAATFLRPREGNSGTAPRLAGLALLGGGVPTAVLNPATAIPMAAGAATAIGAARGANKALGSPAVTRYMMEGSKTVGKAVKPSRAAPVVLPAFLESYLSSQ